MRTAGAVLNAEVVDIEAHFAKCGGCRCAGKTCAHDNDVEVALVGGIHQVLVGFIVGPFLSDRTFGNFGVYLIFREVGRFDIGEVLHDTAGIGHALKVQFLCHISEWD